MHNLGGLVVHHIDTDLALYNARQEALVDQLAIFTFDVLLTELHEVVHCSLFFVVINRFLQVQQSGASYWAALARLHAAHPDAFTL